MSVAGIDRLNDAHAESVALNLQTTTTGSVVFISQAFGAYLSFVVVLEKLALVVAYGIREGCIYTVL